MDKEFLPPGPGSWFLETTHMTGAMPEYGHDLFSIGISRGFGEDR
jgi:hypothetical protein